jgi:hypothetical protein
MDCDERMIVLVRTKYGCDSTPRRRLARWLCKVGAWLAGLPCRIVLLYDDAEEA